MFTAANYLQENNIAHNLYMTRGPVFGQGQGSEYTTVRVYLWPRKAVVGQWHTAIPVHFLYGAAIFQIYKTGI